MARLILTFAVDTQDHAQKLADAIAFAVAHPSNNQMAGVGALFQMYDVSVEAGQIA